MNRRSIVLAGAVACAAAFSSVARAGYAPPPSREDLGRLSQIRQIRKEGKAAENWKFLVSCLRKGKTYKVWVESAYQLSKVRTKEVKDALVGISSDKKMHCTVRMTAVRYLSGHVALLTGEDIEKILRSDEDQMASASDAMTELAPRVNLSVEQVRAILARYPKKDVNNIRVSLVLFAGKHLKCREGKAFDKEIRPLLESFLTDCARKAGPEPAHLRPRIARMMAENGLPGAAEVAIQCLKDGLERRRPEGSEYRPAHIITQLRKVTGASMGYDEKTMKPGSLETIRVIEKWFAWWEKNKDNPKYKIPTLAEESDSPAEESAPAEKPAAKKEDTPAEEAPAKPKKAGDG